MREKKVNYFFKIENLIAWELDGNFIAALKPARNRG